MVKVEGSRALLVSIFINKKMGYENTDISMSKNL